VANEPEELRSQARGLNAITGAMSLVVILLIVQMWLLSATLDSYLAGRHHAVLPAIIISAMIFAACFALYLFVERIDSQRRKSTSSTP
jgi:predicted Co/Zn/Cd cation transporter (cation efflux family)